MNGESRGRNRFGECAVRPGILPGFAVTLSSLVIVSRGNEYGQVGNDSMNLPVRRDGGESPLELGRAIQATTDVRGLKNEGKCT